MSTQQWSACIRKTGTFLAALALTSSAALAGEKAPAQVGTGAPEMPTTAPQRADGVQVWVCQPPRDLTAFDTAERGEKKLEINLISPRNGRANGQVVLASAKAIKGVKATVSDLALEGGKGALPAKQVLVRFPAVAEFVKDGNYVPDNRFDALLPEAPAEAAARGVRTGFQRVKVSDPVVPVGAMQPVWLTVQVPADAAAGTYRGEVTVSADGLAATKVPLSVRVYDWNLPEPKNYTFRTNIWQSHDTVAARYDVPLWSDKHFDLMGQVLDLTKPMGNGFCAVHLINGAFNMGNAESMVRWIDKGNGKYEYDFVPFDKYLDLYEKKIGKPRVLLLSVFVAGSDGGNMKGNLPATNTGENPIKVSRLDPATGKVEPMAQPLYGTDASAEFWKPVLAEVTKRLEKRGWMDVAAIGTGSDAFPTKETVSAFLKAAPNMIWFSTSHKNPGYYLTTDGKRVPVMFREHVWGVGEPRKPEFPMLWKSDNKAQVWVFSRYGAGACVLRQYDCLAGHRTNAEIILQTGWAGLGQSGADFWAMPGGKRPLCCGPHSGVGLGISIQAFTAPAPNGPVATERLEMVAEGMQVVEALVYLLKAIDEKKLDAALTARCQEFLTQRAKRNLEIAPKPPASGPPYAAATFFESWQEDDSKLFALCAEVSAKLGGK